MKKLFISQPMRDKTDEEIKTERENIIKEVTNVLGEVEVIDSFFESAPHEAKPLWFLGKSLELLSTADEMVSDGYKSILKIITNKESLKAIFERQRELMEKYHDIELKSGLLQTEDCPVNLDDKRGQARIKDFSWRITEEVGEALDAITESHY